MNRIFCDQFLNDDLLRDIFYFANPDARDLVMWSLVSKQFYNCSNDMILWENSAKKHSITNCCSVQGFKRSFIKLIQKKFMSSYKEYGLTTHREPSTTKCLSNAGKFPITHNGKIYSVYNPTDTYPVDAWWAGHWGLEIRELGSKCFEQRIRVPSTGVYLGDSVWLNEDILIYTHGKYGHTSFSMIDLNSIKDYTAVPFWISGAICITDANIEFINGDVCVKYNRKDYSVGDVIYSVGDVTIANYDHNYILPVKNLLESLTSIPQNKKIDQILVLREFLPSTVRIPREFICPITGDIMLDPVRDLCRGEDGGHVFERKAILQVLSEGQASTIMEPIGKTTTALCPLGRMAMPELNRISIDFHHRTVEETVPFEDGTEATVPTEQYTALYDVDSQRALIPDEELQIKILEWLKNEFFEKQFTCLPEATKNSIYFHLDQFQKPLNSYWGMGKDAFHNLKGQSSTIDEKIRALHYHLVEHDSSKSIPAPLEDRMKKFFVDFSGLPNSAKSAIYFHLFQIQKPSNAYWGIAQDAFHGRNGKTSTIAEKTEAVRRYMRELQMKVLENS